MKDKKRILMFLFSFIYLIWAILFFISAFLLKIDFIVEGPKLPLNYPMIVGGVEYIFNSFLLFYSTYKSKNWFKRKYLYYLRIIIIIGLVTTAFFIITFVGIILMEYFTSWNQGSPHIEIYIPPWLYEGFILTTITLTVLCVMSLLLLIYYLTIFQIYDDKYYQKF